MGLFDRFKKKQEQPPAPAPVQRNSGKRTGQTKVADKDTEELMEAFDYAVDAMYRAIEAKDGGPPLPPLPLKERPRKDMPIRFMDLPAVDSQGRITKEFLENPPEAEDTQWGMVDRSWSPETEADRFYDSFPTDPEELEKMCKKGMVRVGKWINVHYSENDDVSTVNAMYGLAIHLLTGIETTCRANLPLVGRINGDLKIEFWSVNDETIRKKNNNDVNPFISKEINWLARVYNDGEEIKKELEGFEDGVFRAMISNFVDTHYTQMKRIFDRFSGYGQRIQRIKETNILYYGLPAIVIDGKDPKPPIDVYFKDKLEDYEVAYNNHLMFTRMSDWDKTDGPLEGANVYKKENYDFENSEGTVFLPRLCGNLGLCYLTAYAVRNMKSYFNFNEPRYKETMNRLHSDIKNYLSFKNISPSDENGAKYHALVEKMTASAKGRSEILFNTIIIHTNIASLLGRAVAPNLIRIARKHATEAQIRHGLNDAITRRAFGLGTDLFVIYTQQANYFVPWSQKNSQLLDDSSNGRDGGSSPGQ